MILFGAAVPLHQSILNGGHHCECVCDDVDVCCCKKRIKWCRIGPSLSLEGQRGERKGKGIKQCRIGHTHSLGRQRGGQKEKAEKKKRQSICIVELDVIYVVKKKNQFTCRVKLDKDMELPVE